MWTCAHVRGRVIALAGAGLLAVLGAPAAGASCAGPSPSPSLADQLRAAPVVFVGEVLYTWDSGRSARVRVTSIWNGPVVPTYVDVHGEAPGSGPFSASEEDHTFQTGVTYLFVPRTTRPPFADYGQCDSLTRPYTSDLAGYAPASRKTPSPPSPFDGMQNAIEPYLTFVELMALLVFGGAVFLFLYGRRRMIAGGAGSDRARPQ